MKTQQQLGAHQRRQFVVVGFAHPLVDPSQFQRPIIVEHQLRIEAGAQPGIAVQQLVDRSGIAGQDHDQPMAIVLHSLDQCLHGFVSIGVVLSAGDQAVGLVDEQDTVQRFIDFAIGLGGRLPGVFGDESRAIGFDQVPALQQSERPKMRPTMRAVVVLPVPGFPWNTMCRLSWCYGQTGCLTVLLQRSDSW